MSIERWRTPAQGRSHTVAHAGLVWTVSNAGSLQADLAAQVDETLMRLDSALLAAGSSRQRLLSVQVLLADIADRPAFDQRWCTWIGDEPGHWPQRAVFGAALAPGLLIEIVATAART